MTIRESCLSAPPPEPSEGNDSIVVGGGHNALVCALYLARAGWRPLVLEAADQLGGAVVGEELRRRSVLAVAGSAGTIRSRFARRA